MKHLFLKCNTVVDKAAPIKSRFAGSFQRFLRIHLFFTYILCKKFATNNHHRSFLATAGIEPKSRNTLDTDASTKLSQVIKFVYSKYR